MEELDMAPQFDTIIVNEVLSDAIDKTVEVIHSFLQK